MFECDGCGMTRETSEEVELHITEQDFDDVANIKCWGVMEVGSQVWLAFHNDGVHPMSNVMNIISETLMEYPEVLVEIFKEE